jgi:hypothetical protein
MHEFSSAHEFAHGGASLKPVQTDEAECASYELVDAVHVTQPRRGGAREGGR